MATFTVDPTPQESETILAIIAKTPDTISTAKLASLAKMPMSRARYTLIDLEQKGVVKKVPTKAFNKHYVRYRYEIVKPTSAN